MQWNIPGPNAKVLAQAFQCLSKMGDEVYIEGHKEALILRTVNAGKTAYAAFKFAPDFFSYYPDIDEDVQPCQVSMKAILIAFRFPAHIEKLVESCGIILKSSSAYDEETVEIHFRYKPGLVKKVILQLIDAEIIRDTYNPEAFPSRAALQPRVLAEYLACFHSKELTMKLTKESLHFRNFCENSDDEDMGLRTEMLVPRDDLLLFEVVQEAELTMTLAELRTVLSLADQLNVPIAMHFEESGKPVCFVLKNAICTLEVVLSTIGPQCSESNPAPIPASSSSIDSPMNGEISQLPPCSQPGLLGKILVRPDPIALGDILAPDSDPDSDVN